MKLSHRSPVFIVLIFVTGFLITLVVTWLGGAADPRFALVIGAVAAGVWGALALRAGLHARIGDRLPPPGSDDDDSWR